MRTTLVLDDDVVQQTKHLAVDRKLTFSEFVNQALRRALADSKTGDSDVFSMVTFGSREPSTHHEPEDFAMHLENEDIRSYKER